MKIALSAGEESGDILGSNLMDSLFHCNKDIEFIGLGGDRMIDRGLKSLFPYEEISKEEIYYDQENKVWLWEVDGHLFSNEEFHMQQGGKIEDFENWIRDKEPIDSIEDVTSYKVH